MPELHHSVIIGRPVADVFAFVADVDNFAKWQAGAVSVRRTSAGSTGVGAAWDSTGQVLGRPMTIGMEVTQFDPDRLIVLRTTSGPLEGTSRLLFEDVEGSTRLTLEGRAALSGMFKLFESTAARQAQQMWEANMAKLKALLETA